ncbi:class I SAM-dependent methyltransferase [Polynucleobacter paneuropaeus]|nr:class I SAM-dependent methyltransferase [Polynucleobacter paneuropaeus]
MAEELAMHSGSIFTRKSNTYSEHPDLINWMLVDKANPITCIADLIDSGQKIVDIGCGAGLLGRLIHRNYPDVYISGIDPSIEADHQGLAIYKNFFCGGLEQALEYKWVREADFYIFADVIEHIVQPDIFLRSLVEICPPNATFIFSVPNVAYFANRLDLLFGNWDYSDSGIKEFTHLRFLTLKTIKSILQSAGLQVHSISFLNRSLSPEPLKNYSLIKVLWACFLMKKETFPLAYQFVIVAKKIPTKEIEFHDNGSTSKLDWLISLSKFLIKRI